MKYILLISLFVFLSACEKESTSEHSAYQDILSSYEFEILHGRPDPNGGFELLTSESALVLDQYGMIVWRKAFTSFISMNDDPNMYDHTFVDDFIPLRGGGYALSGYRLYFDSTGNQQVRYTLMRLDNSGNLVWTNQYHPIDNLGAANLNRVLSLQLSNGHIVICGQYQVAAQFKYFLIEADSANGSPLNDVNSFTNSPFLVSSIIEGSPGVVYCAGVQGSSIASAKFDIGNHLLKWFRVFNSAESINVTELFYANAKLLIAGDVNISVSPTQQRSYFYSLDVDTNGQQLNYFQLQHSRQSHSLDAWYDSKLYIIGVNNNRNDEDIDSKSYMMLIKANDAVGNIADSVHYFPSISTKGLLINRLGDGTFNIIGEKRAYGSSDFLHTFFLRTDASGRFE